MASQSPAQAGDTGPYERGWAALTRAMDAGASWSGNERNTVQLNLGRGRFVDVSAVTGLDFADDGRAVVQSDWDGDGAVDLWLRNRSGPQLRFLRGRGGPGHVLALRLEGRSANRDAVGARVAVTAGGVTRTAEVRAGDGYLAQSTLWLSFGLGAARDVERVVVHWPGGDSQELEGLAADGRYHVVQGEPARPVPRREVELASGALEVPAEGPARIVLRTPLPLPPSTLAALAPRSGGPPSGAGAEAGRAMLVHLWAHWCAPCLGELVDLARRADELDAAGLDLLAISVDQAQEREVAAAFFRSAVAPEMKAPGFAALAADPGLIATLEALVDHVVPQGGRGALPTSVLVDAKGWVQVIYTGPVGVDRLLEDARTWGSRPSEAGTRAAHPGRWFFGAPRDLTALSGALASRGRLVEARFYAALARSAGRAPPR